MKGMLIIICIALLTINGCTSTGSSVANVNGSLDNDNNVFSVDTNASALNTYGKETDKQTKAVKKGQIKIKNDAVKKEKSKVRNNEFQKEKVDDEEDIVSILGDDYNKNFDIPIVFNDAVKYFIHYFTTEKRKVFGNWLRRSRYYIPIIKEILKEEGLPEDLVYLAMIESGFNPKAYSTASASGPWQFIYTTGGRYGLRSNYWIDERRDPEKSTIAATKYLRDLFNQFGCWYLAAAGYNAGEGRVGRAIERHNTNDFWELVKYNTLPKETREYIPKLIAAAIIAKEPEKFGFGSIAYDQPVKFMEVKVPAGSPLNTIAEAASIDVSLLKSINPEILRGITPPDINNYAVKIPYSVDKKVFNNNLQTALNNEKRIKGVSAYKVRRGDTLVKIANKYSIDADAMLLVNGSGDGMKIKPGMIVSIPCFNVQSVKEADLRKADKKKALAKLEKEDILQKTEKHKVSAKLEKEADIKKTEKKKVLTKLDTKETSKKPDTQNVEKREHQKTTHTVKKGETLAAISDRYGVDIETLRSANHIKNNTVYPNMKLQLVKHAQKKSKKVVKYHTVKKGETLTAISDRYGVDIETLRSANHIKNNTVYPNMKLKIFKGDV